MSGTEEVPCTRPSPSLSRCESCQRPLEAEAQVAHKCSYCGYRFNWNATPFQDRLSTWFIEFLPYVLWIGFGVIVIIATGGKYG